MAGDVRYISKVDFLCETGFSAILFLNLEGGAHALFFLEIENRSVYSRIVFRAAGEGDGCAIEKIERRRQDEIGRRV